MTKYNVGSDVAVIIEVEADSPEDAQEQVALDWGHIWEVMEASLTPLGNVRLGEWYDDTDVWEDSE